MWYTIVGVSACIAFVLILAVRRKLNILAPEVATNDLAVFFRALANSLGMYSCPDNIAIYFLPKQRYFILSFHMARNIAFWLYQKQYPVTPLQFFSARAVFFDRVVTSSLAKQLVLIGAGYDTRPYRLWNGHKTFELDLPRVTQAKEKAVRLLNKRGIISNESLKNTTYLGYDAISATISEVLKPHNFDWNKPALFLLEGVSYYIPKDHINRLFAEIADKSAAGSILAFDYLLAKVQREEPAALDEHPFAKFVLKSVKQKGEPMITGYEQDELLALAEQHGMKLESHVKNVGDLIGIGRTGQEFMPFISFTKTQG